MRFTLNPRFEHELAHSAEMRLMLKRKAEQVRDEAKRIARAEAYDTGAYHDSIRVVVGEREDGTVTARVVSDDRKANWIEVGTSKMDARAPLRRGLDTLSD